MDASALQSTRAICAITHTIFTLIWYSEGCIKLLRRSPSSWPLPMLPSIFYLVGFRFCHFTYRGNFCPMMAATFHGLLLNASLTFRFSVASACPGFKFLAGAFCLGLACCSYMGLHWFIGSGLCPGLNIDLWGTAPCLNHHEHVWGCLMLIWKNQIIANLLRCSSSGVLLCIPMRWAKTTVIFPSAAIYCESKVVLILTAWLIALHHAVISPAVSHLHHFTESIHQSFITDLYALESTPPPPPESSSWMDRSIGIEWIISSAYPSSIKMNGCFSACLSILMLLFPPLCIIPVAFPSFWPWSILGQFLQIYWSVYWGAFLYCREHSFTSNIAS